MDDFFEAMESTRNKKELLSKIVSMPSNYVGGKRRLLTHIWNTLEEKNVEFESVLDAFSGSGIVSLMFKKMGKKVISNDLLTSSAITAVCLLENESVPITKDDIKFLCTNNPEDVGSFVLDNYNGKFFTENECKFLDRYRRNVEILCGDKFYCGLELLNKATLMSIPNSNFSVYGKDLKSLRSTHNVDSVFYKEKWRDTTRKRRDVNNEITFEKNIYEMYDKYKSAFSLFAIESHINQSCFLGGRYYNGQTVAKLEHRLKHPKNKGREISEIGLNIDPFKSVLTDGDASVFNSDILDLLESGLIESDLIYLDPPYGGASSDYVVLYRFLEEYLYEDKLENIEHIQNGGKRFCRKKGYSDQFEHLISLCGNFKNWLISYNESSFADIDTIVGMIRNTGRTNVDVCPVPITYQYRKDKSKIEEEDFVGNYADNEHTFSNRGTEYLILVR